MIFNLLRRYRHKQSLSHPDISNQPGYDLSSGSGYYRVLPGPHLSILVSFLSVIGFDYFFVPPFLTLAVSDTEYLLTFIGLFGVGLVISALTARVRDQAEVAQRREAETATLYD